MFTTIKCNQAEAQALLGGLMCNIGKMVGVALWRKGTIFTDNFGKSDLDALVLKNEFIGALMADGIENNDTDATYKESLMKVRSQTDPGRKGFVLTYEKPPCFHNEINKLNGSENWDVTPILDDGSIFAYRGADGKIRGFAAKIFVGLYKLPILGVDESGTRVEIDLLPKSLVNWQSSGVALANTEIDFMEVQPIAGLNITAPILTANQTTTSVKVTNLCSDAVVMGLTDATSWKLERNGVLEAVTAVSFNPNTSEYTFTHAALQAGDSVVFLTNKNGQNVYALDTNYYSGNSRAKTVA